MNFLKIKSWNAQEFSFNVRGWIFKSWTRDFCNKKKGRHLKGKSKCRLKRDFRHYVHKCVYVWVCSHFYFQHETSGTFAKSLNYCRFRFTQTSATAADKGQFFSFKKNYLFQGSGLNIEIFNLCYRTWGRKREKEKINKMENKFF